MRVDFESPPVSEVGIAIYFDPPLLDLRSEHIGVFWVRIKDKFPVVRQQLPVGTEIPPGTEVFPMPRYWFVADDEATVLQIQKNAFMLNWQRQRSAYPRFHNLKRLFDLYYAAFEHFVSTDLDLPQPSIDFCELTYVNSIEQCPFWKGPPDTQNVIPSFSLIGSGIDDSNSSGFNCEFAYHVHDTAVNIAVRSGMKNQEPRVPLLVLQLKGGVRMDRAAKTEMDRWLEDAHTTIRDCFLSITNREIQDEYWKRRERPS